MRTYAIINVSDITCDRINDCKTSRGCFCNMNEAMLRKSIDDSKAIIKWDGTNPEWVAELGLTTYTQTEMISFLSANANWENEGGF